MTIDCEKKMKLKTLPGEVNKLPKEDLTLYNEGSGRDFSGANNMPADSPIDSAVGSAKCVNITINSAMNDTGCSVVNLNITINSTSHSKAM